MVERLDTDILILGAGGAGLFAALHAKQAAPELEVTVAVKGLPGTLALHHGTVPAHGQAARPRDDE